MYVGRTPDGAIFGTSTVKQTWTTEELPDTHPDVVAFANRTPPKPTTAQKFAAMGITVDDLKAFMAGK